MKIERLLIIVLAWLIASLVIWGMVMVASFVIRVMTP